MRAIRLLSLRRLRTQPLRAAMAALAVAAGVSLAVAVTVVMGSIDTSLRTFSRELAGPTPLRVVGATSRGGLDASVVPAIERTDGVAAAIPLVQAVTIAEDSAGTEVPVVALGIDCRVERLVGDFGCTPELLGAARGRALAVSPSLVATAGERGELRTDGERVSLAGALAVPALDELESGHIAVFALADAQRLFARDGRLDAVYVDVERGASVDAVRARLEQAIGGWNGVLTAADPPPAIEAALSGFVPLFSMLGLFALGTGAVLVHNSVSLSMEERRRQLAIVAALGGKGRVVAGGAVMEAAVIGAFGGVLGAGLGIVIAHPITRSLSDFVEKVAGLRLQVHTSAGTFVIGALLGLAVGALSAAGPARRALRLDVAAELSNRDDRAEAEPPRLVRRLALRSVVAGVSLVLCWVAQRDGALEPWQATLAQFCFAGSALLLLFVGATLAPLLLRRLQSRSETWAAPWRLAIANLTRDPKRTGVMATAVSAASVVAFLTASLNQSISHDISESLRDNLDGVGVSTVDPNNSQNIDAKLSPRVLQALGTMPEVASVERGTSLLTGQEAGELVGVSAFEDPWLDLPMIKGTLDRDRFDAGEVLIGPGLARTRGLRPGDQLLLPTPTGFADLRVLGIWQDGDFGGSNVTMSFELLERLYGPQPAATVTVEPVAGVSDVELKQAILAAQLDPDLEVLTVAELSDEIATDIAGQMAPFWVLQRGLLFVSFVAVLTTLLLAGIQRRREFGLLGAIGMEPRTVAKMVLGEAGVVATAGVICGGVLGLAMLWAFHQTAPVVIGYRNTMMPAWGVLALYGAVSVAVAMLAAVIPARRARAVNVVEALQYE